MKSYIIFIVLVFATIFDGCTYTGTIRTNIAPTAMVAKRFPTKVGVHFTPRLANYEEVSKPATYYGSAHTFTFKIGPALQEALLKSVESAYSNVEVTSALASPGEYGMIINFDLQNVNVRVEFAPGFWRAAAKSNAVIYVSMEIIDGSSMQSLKRLTVNGNGFSSKDTKGGADAQKQFSLAIEDAIQQLSENTSNLLISGVGEPK